jgi:CSLREA domain-containing protein
MPKPRLYVVGAGLLLFLALAAAVPPTAFGATTVTVTTTLDIVQAGDGACSLREATLYANGTTERDCAAVPASGTTTIVLSAQRYTLAGQPLTLTGNAKLLGAGAAATTIAGAPDPLHASQVLVVAVGANVAVSDVTITGGVSGQTCVLGCANGAPIDGDPGGGISNNGTLALTHVVVTGNRTSPGAVQANCTTQIQFFCPGGNGGDGGGIANFGVLVIADSAITANSTGAGASGKPGATGAPNGTFGGAGSPSGSGGRGGGIANFATLNISNSTIAGNSTGVGAAGADGGLGTTSANGLTTNPGGSGSNGGDGGFGGGIESDGPLVISGSTISGNQTGIGGAGGNGGNGSNNVFLLMGRGGDGGIGGSGGEGGGVDSDTDMTVTNSTITDNSTAPAGASGHGGSFGGVSPSQVGGANGGGVEEHRMGSSLSHVTVVSNRAAGFGGGVDGDGGTITAVNSISASNHAVFGQNCAGVITDLGGNIEFGDASCPSGFLRADPRVSSLANNGGPTQTVALQPGSAAIDHVRTCVLGADQRGVPRSVGSACDSGAYQVAPPSVSGASASSITTSSAAVTASVNANLRDTTVVVNYGRTASYGSSTPPVDIGAGNGPAPFSAGLGGLTPGATYHFDVVATNADGQTTTGDGTFTAAPPLAASIAGASTVGPTLSLTIACAGGSGPNTCTGPIRLTTRLGGKRRHSVSVADAAYSVQAGQQVTVRIALNRTGRTVLTQRYVLATTLSVSGTTPVTTQITFKYPRVTSKTPFALGFAPGSTTFTGLSVPHVPPGGKVTVICHGGGCPFSVRVFAPRRGRVSLTRFFEHSPLRPGATLQLRITAVNRVGEIETFVIHSGRQPGVIHQCLPPGAARPARCVTNAPH